MISTMPMHRRQLLNRWTVSLAIATIGLLILLNWAGAAGLQPKSHHNVFIAFGFHVNLYHSFGKLTPAAYCPISSGAATPIAPIPLL